MSPFFAASLSLVPGLGHLAMGKRGRALALFVVDFGILVSLYFLRSTLGRFLTFFSYLIAMIPAAVDTFALAHGKANRFCESKFYIVVMLLKEGFWALPLLWESPLFSKRNKITWSIAVPALALLYFSFLGFFGMRFINETKF